MAATTSTSSSSLSSSSSLLSSSAVDAAEAEAVTRALPTRGGDESMNMAREVMITEEAKQMLTSAPIIDPFLLQPITPLERRWCSLLRRLWRLRYVRNATMLPLHYEYSSLISKMISSRPQLDDITKLDEQYQKRLNDWYRRWCKAQKWFTMTANKLWLDVSIAIEKTQKEDESSLVVSNEAKGITSSSPTSVVLTSTLTLTPMTSDDSKDNNRKEMKINDHSSNGSNSNDIVEWIPPIFTSAATLYCALPPSYTGTTDVISVGEMDRAEEWLHVRSANEVKLAKRLSLLPQINELPRQMPMKPILSEFGTIYLKNIANV
jgi:hypothetical protein